MLAPRDLGSRRMLTARTSCAHRVPAARPRLRCGCKLERSRTLVSDVRLLSAADIPAGMRLKEAAGWNQTAADWERVLTLEADGCFAIECDGEVRATTTAVCF